MKFLASSPSGLWMIDGPKAECLEKTSYNTCYWGISWDETNVYAIKREYDEVDFLHVFDRNMKEIDKFLVPCKAAHQIVWDHKLYIANTGFNRITTWDGKDCGEIAWNPSGRDDNHINSVWSFKDVLFALENRGKPELGGRSNVVRIDKKSGKVDMRFQLGRDAHNIFCWGATTWVCSSGDQSIIQHDMSIREIVKECRINHAINRPNVFPRGMSYTGKHFFAGVSQSFRKGEQRNTTGGLVVVESEGLKFVEYYEFPSMDSIHDLRLIDGIDYAHNQRIPF